MSQLTYEPRAGFDLVSPVEGRILSGEFGRYLIVSAVALAIDIGALALLSVGFGLHYLVANPMAFALGALAAYLGSVHWAFRRRKLSNTGIELAVFVGIGIGGLAINETTLWLGIEVAAVSLTFAKIGAALMSFAFNFIVRKIVLFST